MSFLIRDQYYCDLNAKNSNESVQKRKKRQHLIASIEFQIVYLHCKSVSVGGFVLSPDVCISVYPLIIIDGWLPVDQL